MRGAQLILDQVERLMAFRLEADAAYPIRSRIGRIVASCRRFAELEIRDSKNRRCRPAGAPTGADGALREMLRAAERLAAVSLVVCQPSEPLDPRWRQGWAAVISELEALRRFTYEVLRPAS